MTWKLTFQIYFFLIFIVIQLQLYAFSPPNLFFKKTLTCLSKKPSKLKKGKFKELHT